MEGWCGRRGGCGGLPSLQAVDWPGVSALVRCSCLARSLGKPIGVVSEGGWGVGKCASERFRSDRSLRDSPLLPLIFAFVSLSFDFAYFQPFPPIICEKSAVFFVFSFL